MRCFWLVVAISLALPSIAAAQSPYVGIGVGPAVRLDDWPTQVRVEQEIGVFFNREPTGFFLGFAPSQSWGSDWWILEFPVRLGGLVRIYDSRDVTFALGGTGTLGVAVSDQFDTRDDPDPWFLMSFAFVLRLMFGRDFAIYLRPVGFEFAFSDTGRYGNEAIRYVAVGGIQYFF